MNEYTLDEFLNLPSYLEFKKNYINVDRNYSVNLISESRNPFTDSVVHIIYDEKVFAVYTYDVYGTSALNFNNYININDPQIMEVQFKPYFKQLINEKNHALYLLNYLRLIELPQLKITDQSIDHKSIEFYQKNPLKKSDWSSEELLILDQITLKYSKSFCLELKKSLEFVDPITRLQVLKKL